MSFEAGSQAPGSAFPTDDLFPIPAELPFQGAPITIPTGDGNLWSVMGRIFAAGLEMQNDGDVVLRRYARGRTKPWRPPSSETYNDYDMVAYAGGDVSSVEKGVRFVERKFLISRPHTILTSLDEMTDTIVCDGVEYPLWKVKPVPRAGSNIMFWSVMTRLGIEPPEA